MEYILRRSVLGLEQCKVSFLYHMNQWYSSDVYESARVCAHKFNKMLCEYVFRYANDGSDKYRAHNKITQKALRPKKLCNRCQFEFNDNL